MSAKTAPAGSPLPEVEAPIAPSAERWKAMTASERGRFFQEVYDAFNTIQRAMAEGQPHRRAKSSTLQALVLHFKASGRQIYVAEELPVIYPDERAFTPDLMAVLDIPQPDPDEDRRMAWVVADEGKGPDFLLEVLHKGNRIKDLVKNVAEYVRLGIREYFIYDLLNYKLYGYRLAQAGGAYEELGTRLGGRLTSQILGLDLGIVERRLRLFAGVSELANYEEYFERVTQIMTGIEARAQEAQKRAEEAEEALRTAVLDLAEAYGLEITEERRTQIAQASLEELQALRLALKSRRSWP